MNGPSPSRISKIFDHYMKEIALALPEHSELMDTDEIDENPDAVLKAGYGVTVGSGENTEECMEATAYYYRREFTVILTRSVLATVGDTKTRKDQWKQSLEDLHQVLKRLTGQYSILDPDDPTKVLSFKSAYANDSGPRATVIRDMPYVFIELTVSAEYREPTTGG